MCMTGAEICPTVGFGERSVVTDMKNILFLLEEEEGRFKNKGRDE